MQITMKVQDCLLALVILHNGVEAFQSGINSGFAPRPSGIVSRDLWSVPSSPNRPTGSRRVDIAFQKGPTNDAMKYAIENSAMHSVDIAATEVEGSDSNDEEKLFESFGKGIVRDYKARMPFFWSDIKDGLNAQCLAATMFLFFACLSPAVGFGALYETATGGAIGTGESWWAWFYCSSNLLASFKEGLFLKIVHFHDLVDSTNS